jgi:beta-lactamase class D
VSSVPVYQELARRVGQERMLKYVKQARYGNANVGGGIDKFWLEGDLRISALEQIEFLQKLQQNKLPFSIKTMTAVKDIMVVEKGERWTLRGKTGIIVRVKPNIGWWVGWLERGDEVWYFALHIDINKQEQVNIRKDIVKAVLKGEGVLP